MITNAAHQPFTPVSFSDLEAIPDTAQIVAAADGYFMVPGGVKSSVGSTLLVSKSAGEETLTRLEFDLAAVPAGACIVRAVFRCDLKECHIAQCETSMTLACYDYAADDLQNLGNAFSGSPVGVTVLTRAHKLGVFDLDITRDCVQKALSQGSLGLCLRLEAPQASLQTHSLLLRSTKNSVANPRPQLVLQYIALDAPIDRCVTSV